MIIATCRSSRHVNFVTEDLIINLKKKGIHSRQPEGKPKCDWTIVDTGSIVFHLFRPEIRNHYNLEKLWGTNFEALNRELI
ncbi:MAG: Ribosomal silencing factor RsfS [Alphaproteobacteria bacterium MarineAlpha5_Bin11]|nr:MAG: Ribosomal silencing factor RsfS [Alphaproteobacteria bacterium MarineAlpha5_Bin11]PPR51414.1 MAG: Ribosomal silencing factor RsfS [Alphaproteobacteria bacterium MarineAlpha5_Bin10]|tara:strand:- start:1199 stop:1441 length:243 start_codon:yes stop_codon:yes gene_type:complete